jgi:hypothetical protein
MEELEIKDLFFVNYLPTFSFPWLLICSWNLYKLLNDLHEDVSIDMLCHLFYNMLLDLCLTILLNSQKQQVENDTINNASFEEHPSLFSNYH